MARVFHKLPHSTVKFLTAIFLSLNRNVRLWITLKILSDLKNIFRRYSENMRQPHRISF